MTEPLTPPDCDLRGLSYMPLDVQRLRDSDLALISTGDEFKAAVLLWSASWLQVPAASLPDDDLRLAKLLGMEAKAWRKVKLAALRGWEKCSDGRLYHSVVAEKACEAWAERLKYRDKRDKDRERLKAWREEVAERERLLKESQQDERDGNDFGNDDETRFETRSETPPEEKGTGREGIIDGGGERASAAEKPSDDWPSGDPAKALVETIRSPWLDPQKSHGLVTTAGAVVAWKRLGASWNRDVIPVVTGVCAKQRDAISTWGYFDKAIARAVAENTRTIALPEARASPNVTNIVDRLGQEQAEARRRAFALMDAENG